MSNIQYEPPLQISLSHVLKSWQVLTSSKQRKGELAQRTHNQSLLQRGTDNNQGQ